MGYMLYAVHCTRIDPVSRRPCKGWGWERESMELGLLRTWKSLARMRWQTALALGTGGMLAL